MRWEGRGRKREREEGKQELGRDAMKGERSVMTIENRKETQIEINEE